MATPCVSPPQRLVVVSHSCDIAADPAVEPEVELVVADIIDEAQACHRNGHAIRVLHLPARGSDETLWLQLQVADRVRVAKNKLLANAPWTAFSVAPKERNTLRFWLAQRYSRCAFPDAFVRWLKQSGVETKFDKLAKRYSAALVGIYFDLDDDAERDDPADPYTLGVYLVYDAGDAAHAEQARQAQSALRNIFERRCCLDAGWRWIELVDCDAVSDMVFSLRDARTFRRWRFEHRSIAGEPRDDSE